MEIALGIGIGIIIGLMALRRDMSKKKPINSDAEHERKRLQKADEELITVILPTIENDR